MAAMSRWVLAVVLFCAIAAACQAMGVEPFILQSNDVDPTAPTSQPIGRWYHWLGADPAIWRGTCAIDHRVGAL